MNRIIPNTPTPSSWHEDHTDIPNQEQEPAPIEVLMPEGEEDNL